jgi:hypothetical protein
MRRTSTNNQVKMTGRIGADPRRGLVSSLSYATVAVVSLAMALAGCSLPGRSEPIATPLPVGTSSASTANGSGVVIHDSLLASTIARIRSMSPAFDSAMVAVERSGMRVYIGTDIELRKQIPWGFQRIAEWQAITTTYPLTADGARGRPIEHAAVIVRLEPLREALLASTTSASDVNLIERHLERVLAHEIYGHLMPQLQLGLTAPIACDDPQSAETWYDACVMTRERHVVAELSLARITAASVALASGTR